MKLLVKIFLVLVIFLLLSYGGLWLLVDWQAKPWLEHWLLPVLGKTAAVKSVSFQPPLGLNIEGITAKNFSIKKARLNLDLFSSLRGKVCFKDLEFKGLHLILRKNGKRWEKFSLGEKHSFVLALNPKKLVLNSAFAADPQAKFNLPFRVKKLELEKAEIDFFDYDAKAKWFFKDIDLKAVNLSPDFKGKTSIFLKGKIYSGLSQKSAEFSAQGFFFLPQHLVKTKAEIAHFDYFSLSPYLPSSWRPENIGLEKAVFSLQLNIKSKDDYLLADTSVFLDAYKFKELENPSSSKYYLLKSLMSIFRNRNARPLLRFSLRIPFAKISWPEIKRRLEKKLAQASFEITANAITSQVKEIVNETLGKALDAKAGGKNSGVIDIEEIKKEFEKTFKGN